MSDTPITTDSKPLTPNRAEQTRQTRERLMAAALQLLTAERSFSQLSLREVSRQAGLAAPSFYHHFPDMTALGLALIDEAGVTLRRMQRDSRSRALKQGADNAIDASLQTFFVYMDEHPALFRLLIREHNTGALPFRKAIDRELDWCVDELTTDVNALLEQEGRHSDARLLAEIAVLITLEAAAAMQDASPTERLSWQQRLHRKLMLVVLGARAMATASGK